ncbi:hypothetical protein Bsph_2800 [Lysinibacillus sphaericus C3-41]|uniref:Uncharacterized protein n=1 Tax=Lysinibacillus sphaericus (strain C3-41) TaxID=444177 RepID=B1HMG8_LYSSC|nr:hypothetical protein [Lysinibacillus sphaericus]ACA40334.1 hypothetical protein Bsph_2800 [Lysinibacillus sphaericus C3-41]
MSDLHKPANEQEELTEEEFIELVLTEQQKALAQEQEDRLQGKKTNKTQAIRTLDCMEYGFRPVFQYIRTYFSNLFHSSYRIYESINKAIRTRRYTNLQKSYCGNFDSFQ